MRTYDNELVVMKELILPASEFYFEASEKLTSSIETFEFLAIACEGYLKDPDKMVAFGIGQLFPIVRFSRKKIIPMALSNRVKLAAEYLSLFESDENMGNGIDLKLMQFFVNHFVFTFGFIELVVEFSQPMKTASVRSSLRLWFDKFEGRWNRYVGRVFLYFNSDVVRAIKRLSGDKDLIEVRKAYIKKSLSDQLWMMAFPELATCGSSIKANLLQVIYSRPMTITQLEVLYKKLK
ncbi:MAG: hypothetical protein OQJ89_12855 [Kangiellaceae bacterium]|nr:hypothetical protein [Kangiellaceae bacterium]MCW9000202.1 hypothetical protein [Kangiellaceae bacterium]MCW9017852.1 hypothetical protein [Kangiellaceae bacterium]